MSDNNIDLRDLIWLKGWVKFVISLTEPDEEWSQATDRLRTKAEDDREFGSIWSEKLRYWRVNLRLEPDRRAAIVRKLDGWRVAVSQGKMKWEDVYRDE